MSKQQITLIFGTFDTFINPKLRKHGPWELLTQFKSLNNAKIIINFTFLELFFSSLLFLVSSRIDTGLVLTSLLTWASGESKTKGKGEKVCGSNLMI